MESDRTSLYLTPELKAGLRQAAKRLGVTQTHVVQEALAQYLANLSAPKFSCIGVGEDTEVTGENSEQWLRANWGKTLDKRSGASRKRK